MSIVIYLAKNRFNWVDHVGIMFFVSLLSNRETAWALGAFAIAFLASIILRIVSSEHTQRTGAQ